MRPTCALSYAARVGLRANHSDPRHAPGEIARVRPLLRPADSVQGRCLVAAHCPHCFFSPLSRGVILIGALSKGLRLPLLRKSGRLRHNTRTGSDQHAIPFPHPLAPTPHTKDCRDGSLTLMRPVTCKSAMPDAFGVSLSPSRVTGMVLTLLARSSANSAWCTFAVFKCEDAF